jgi:hypothetical protein
MVKRPISSEFWWENVKQRNHLEDLSTEGRITLAEEILAYQGRC